MIAIEQDQRLFYEGRSNYGIAVWPSPFVSVATVIRSGTDENDIPEANDLGTARLVFREDSYDPVTRIRRGRFYVRDDGVQPQTWRVQQHPGYQEETGHRRDPQGYLIKPLYGFQVWHAHNHLNISAHEILVALGIRDALSLWKVVGIERISTNEDLVTLKAQSNLGVLPELNAAVIPNDSRARIVESLNKVLDAAYVAGPESVIDRCRDAGAAMLGAWLEQTCPGALRRDLGKLADLAVEKAEKVIAGNAARIIARLHARAKPNEQINHPSRLLVEADAQLAIECVAVIMREIGWARS